MNFGIAYFFHFIKYINNAFFHSCTKFFYGFNIVKKDCSELEPLPKQEKSEGLRGVYDIDKNINEKTIDDYLGRSDVAYRDVRMLEDTATWENKGGERDLTGFVKGFEVIPYAYLTEFPQAYIDQKKSENVTGLYEGKTLTVKVVTEAMQCTEDGRAEWQIVDTQSIGG